MYDEVLKSFAVQDLNIFCDENSNDFALIELWWLAEGNNSHKNPISREVLYNCANTVLGKFVVCKYNDFLKDATTHVSDEIIVGYVPPNGKVEFKEKDGKLFAVSKAVLSKIYASDVYDMFKSHNQRSVSVEFACQEGDVDVEGNRPILGFNVRGITILGLHVKPSVEGADMKVIKFSSADAQEYYNQRDTLGQLNQFSLQIKEKFESKAYKIDKSKESLSNSSWGNVDKADLRNKIMKASNRDSLVKSVYMKVEDGWQDAPSEKLKYPVMQFKGDTLVYNRGGLSSALGYAKAENEIDVVNKIESIYKKLGLDKENENMSNKNFEIEGREAWGEVIQQVQSHEGKGAYVDSVEKDHIIFTKDGVRYRVDADVEVGKDDKKVKSTIKWDTLKKDYQQKQFDEDDVDDDDDDDDDQEEIKDTEDKEKKMSYDANIDTAALNAMLEEETDAYRKIIREAMAKKDMNIIMADYLQAIKDRDRFMQENKELKEYKEACESQEVKCAVDNVLAEVKEDLSVEDYKKLQEEGMACTKETFDAFSNSVKAFAYDSRKKKNHVRKSDHIAYKAFAESSPNNDIDVEALYDKYSK